MFIVADEYLEPVFEKWSNIFSKKNIMGSKYSSATIFYIFIFTCMFMFPPKIVKMNPPKKNMRFFFQVGGSSTTLEIYFYTIHGG